MASTGCIFLCGACDRKICDETFSHKIRKGNAYVSGVLDCVKNTSNGKNFMLVCSCKENIGEFVAYKKELKYCLYLKKVRRCMINSEGSGPESVCHEEKAVPLSRDLFSPTVSKTICDASNKPAKNSTVYEKEAEKENEVMQLKQTIAALEERIKSMEKENVEKFRDVCGVLLSHKLEIQRLQEIIWILHPNFNLDQAFTVDDEASYFLPDLDTSTGGLNVEED